MDIDRSIKRGIKMKKTVLKIKCALLISLMMAGTAVTAYAGEQTEKTYGMTEEQYMWYKTVRSSEIRMAPLTIWYGDESINVSVFYSNWKIYVPLRNIVELMDRSIIYDAKSNVISIIGRKPESKSDAVFFGEREVKMEMNDVPVYLGDKEVTDIETGKVNETGYNCEGNTYISLKALIDAIGYYSYYDDGMQLHIAKESGRLLMLPIKEGGEVYLDAMESSDIPYDQRNNPVFDDEIMDEAVHRTWSMYSQPQYSQSLNAFTFSYDGKDYIYTSVERDTGNEGYRVGIAYEVLPEAE